MIYRYDTVQSSIPFATHLRLGDQLSPWFRLLDWQMNLERPTSLRWLNQQQSISYAG